MTDLFQLNGRVALVAGAASGIGQSAAKGLATAGAAVICADINAEGAAATASAIGGQSIALDVTDESAVQAAVKKIGTIDILVSTPAVNVRKPLLNYTAD